MLPPKLVILDLDLTILDTLKRFYGTFNKTLEEFGLNKVSWDIFMDNFKRDTLNNILPANINRRMFWEEFRRLYSRWMHEEDKPIPGALETLKWLKQKGFKVVVSTGRDADPTDIWRELRHFGLDKYIDDVFTINMQDRSVERIPFLRTDLLRLILKKYMVDTSNAIFVGDYWVDMESGKETGLVTIAVLTGYKEPDLLKRHGADYILKDISELPKLISDMGFFD